MKRERNLFKLKLHYMLHGMGGSPIVPFGSLVGRQLGITAQSMGLVFCAVPIAGIIIKPLLGGVADKYNIKKLVLMGVILSAIIHFSSLKFLPPMPVTEYTKKITCDPLPHTSLQRDPCLLEKFDHVYGNSSVTCDVDCINYLQESVTVQPNIALDKGNNILLPISWNHCSDSIREFSCSIKCPGEIGRLIDLSGDSKDKDTAQYYNYQYWLYVWVITMASISFGCGCTFQNGLLYNYSWAFLLMLVSWSADIMVVSQISFPTQSSCPENPWARVGSIITSPRAAVFLLWNVLVGFVFGAMGFKSWLLEDLAGINSCTAAKNLKLLQGLCLTVNCLGETPVFLISGKLMEKLGSKIGMILVLIAHGIRLLYYSIIVTPWQILPIEILQGVTFGFYFPCLVSVSSEIAPPGTETTMTALAWLMFDGVGGSMGGWSSAIFYSQFGGSYTFWIYGWISLTGAGIIHYLNKKYVLVDQNLIKVSVS